MEILHVLQEYQDTSRIMWNLYFVNSGLLTYSFGCAHPEIHEATIKEMAEKCQGKEVIGGYILPTLVGIRAPSTKFTQEQRTLIAKGLRALIEKLNIETEGLTIAYTEDDRPYFAEEFFAEYLSSQDY